MSIVTTLLSGAVGGLVATLGAKWLWRFYSRPELKFKSGILKEGESHPQEPMAWGQYRVEISNIGRSVASNCKPRIRLVGLQETSKKVADLGPDGREFHDVSIMKRYVIDLVPTWNESETPTRIDLNRGESAQFDLFSVHSEAAPPSGSDTDIRFGDQKSLDEIEETGDIWETEPIRIETSQQGDFSRPIVETKSELTKEIFKEIEWVEQSVNITSADTNKIEGDLDFVWDDVIPEVNIHQ
ncbi:hypothetical protein Halru_2803 [Halovivax ruber XH-70]|uniref:Uncharacterized protein n=1 Tax=Halovivax ruber (strain DSM 18193 / JCM 13892 / XH-70) TaxID=797302 RepID=L0IF43_HALRX|nr:hypothetical protein [Halovivax ruber]AGB17374.1 hypothetical protein Halru_2803 [Halovivax ruber XH-70]